MNISKTVKVAIVAAVTAAALAVGGTAAMNAGASGPNTTYYACLKSGKLTSVGTVSSDL